MALSYATKRDSAWTHLHTTFLCHIVDSQLIAILNKELVWIPLIDRTFFYTITSAREECDHMNVHTICQQLRTRTVLSGRWNMSLQRTLFDTFLTDDGSKFQVKAASMDGAQKHMEQRSRRTSVGL